MVGGGLHAGWEDHLVRVIHMYRDVGPVKDGIGQRCAIEKRNRRFHVRSIGVERQTYQPLHAMTAFRLAKPNRLAAILVLSQRIINRHERRVAMVVERTPFDTAGDPGTQHTDQRGFDYMLPVKEIIVIGLVGGGEQAPPNLGQNAYFDESVF